MTRMLQAGIFAALVAVAAGCGAQRHHVAVIVAPQRSAAYQPIDVRVTGLRPHENVTLRMTSTDFYGTPFAAHATYAANSDGLVDLALTPPVNRLPYAGAWRMGLLTEMRAMRGDPAALYYYDPHRASTFAVTVHNRGTLVGSATFKRALSLKPLTIRLLSVATDGFQGGYAAPAGAKRRPAVLELGGSEGGAKYPPTDLAANGIPALFVGYFHAPGLPDTLHNIPLEYFVRALKWLDRQPGVDPNRVTVMGTSYCSEAALLLGVHYPKLVHAVAAISTGNESTCGILGANRVETRWLGAAWTFEGKPVPCTRQWDNPDPSDVPASVIPVERIQGPIFLTCGVRDSVWVSCYFAQAIKARLKAHHFRYPVELFTEPGGHGSAQVYRYIPGMIETRDALPGDEWARERLYPHAIDFLRRG